MSRASPLIRSLPRSTVRPAIRSYHASTPSQAATAPAPTARPNTPRRVAVPASAARISRAPPKPLAQSQIQARPVSSPTPTSAAASNGVEDDFDMPMPEVDSIEDYAHLAQPSARAPTPSSSNTRPTTSAPSSRTFAPSTSTSSSSFGDVTPSPPLTSFPNDGYRPLPTTASGEGVGLGDTTSDWSTSFAGLSQQPFDRDIADALLRPLQVTDIELKPDGLLYLPEIKYRRTLNAAFGPGGWGLAPRGETHVGPRIVSREWGLVCLGRLVSIARGEQEYFDPSGVPTATEACKSNALMRCCKDLGIASELWDPSFIRDFKSKHCLEVWVEHSTQKKKRKMWRKKNAPKFDYPYKEVGPV